MKKPLNSLKARILYPLIPEPIQTKSDYNRRMISLIVGIVCFVGGLVLGIIMPKDHPMQIYTYVGIGCSLPFMPKIFKATFRTAKVSYKIGKNLTYKEYIEVNQVSSNQYRATHKEEHDGGVIAYLVSGLVFLCMWMFYTLIGPVVVGVKTYKTAKLISAYKNATVEITDDMIEK